MRTVLFFIIFYITFELIYLLYQLYKFKKSLVKGKIVKFDKEEYTFMYFLDKNTAVIYSKYGIVKNVPLKEIIFENFTPTSMLTLKFKLRL